jgi:hypothetical protein
MRSTLLLPLLPTFSELLCVVPCVVCVQLANMLFAYLNLGSKALGNKVSLLRVFEFAYPLAATVGLIKSPLVDTILAALQP